MRLQLPGSPTSSLLNELVDRAGAANSGGAIVAWATRSGVRAFLGQPEFVALLKRGPFRLVVGTDSITDTKAVEELRSASATYPLLSVQFIVNSAMTLFHPKVWWFGNGEETDLVVGSGNLTSGGLIGNWEAFTVERLGADDSTDFVRHVDDWLSTIEPGLVDFDDQHLIDAVAANTGDERQVRRSMPKAPPPPLANSDVQMWLVAELNKSRVNGLGQSMFSQASFDKATFEKFFNYAGSEVPLAIRSVSSDGSLGPVEARRGRYKAASINYYFEVGAAAGLPYPDAGKPIAIFGRVANGEYVYQLMLPGEASHSHALDWLGTNVGPESARMRRVIIDSATFAAHWPNSPLLAVALDS